MNIIQLPTLEINDLPKMLRDAADRIENGEDKIENIIMVAEMSDGKVDQYGWGSGTNCYFRVSGMLSFALQDIHLKHLATMHEDDDE